MLVSKQAINDRTDLCVFQTDKGAPKVMARIDPLGWSRLETERKILWALDHPSIPKMTKLVCTDRFQAGQGGVTAEAVYNVRADQTLAQWLHENKSAANSAQRVDMARRVSLAAIDMLKYLHDEESSVYLNFRAEYVVLNDPVQFLGWEFCVDTSDSEVKYEFPFASNNPNTSRAQDKGKFRGSLDDLEQLAYLLMHILTGNPVHVKGLKSPETLHALGPLAKPRGDLSWDALSRHFSMLSL